MRTASFVITALFAASAASAAPERATPADAQAAPADDQVVLVQDDEELGFVDKYFPFTLNVTHDSVDENLVGLWIGVLLPFGFIWSPYVFGDEKPGEDFVVDAIIIALIHLAPLLGLFFVWIPIVGWALGVVLWIYALVNGFYLTPVAIINAYDRSLGGGGGGGRKRSKPKKERRRRRRDEDAMRLVPEAPSVAALGQETVVAY